METSSPLPLSLGKALAAYGDDESAARFVASRRVE